MITLLLLRMILRRTWPAVVVWMAIGTGIVMPDSGAWPLGVIYSLIVVSLVVVVLFRFGMLCVLFGMFTAGLLAICPPEADLTAWYATPTVISLALVAGMAISGFRITLAGRPLLRDLLSMVGAKGAREKIRAALNARGWREGVDYTCAA